jgi:SAM-dependent methyltransferase
MPSSVSTPARADGAGVARELLREFLAAYPFQPATAIWRAFEVAAVVQSELPRGVGLDLGCGDGKLTRLVAERAGGWRLVGVDPDPAEVELARAGALYERLHCAPGDRVPEPDGTFDFVFSSSVLEHIPEVAPVLRETARLLRPGGTLVATVPSDELHACLAGPPAAWRLLFGSSRAAYREEFDRRIAHAYYWSDARWTEELRDAGFSSVRVTPCFHDAAVRRFETVANTTSGLLYKLQGGRRRPIEIQRQLGLRSGARAPRLVAELAARVLEAGLDRGGRAATRHGARLIVATT